MVIRDDNQCFQNGESTVFTNENYHTIYSRKLLVSYLSDNFSKNWVPSFCAKSYNNFSIRVCWSFV